LASLRKPDPTLLWHGEIKPGLVPRGCLENILTKLEPVEDIGCLGDSAALLAGYAQKWNGHGAEKAEIKAAQMFCEIQLGQLLGPNPGQGSNYSPDQKGFAQIRMRIQACRLSASRTSAAITAGATR
jgi:hypothetical protein